MDRRSLLRGGGLAALLTALPSRLFGKVLGYPRLMQGPMIGPASGGFTVWGRASGAFDVLVEYASDRSFSDLKTTAAVRADATEDHVVKLKVDGLEPGSDCYYRLKLDGVNDRYAPLPFRTRAAPTPSKPLRIAFGSCARLQFDPVQPIWKTIAAMEPDLFLWLGDNIYADSDQAAAFEDLYARQRSIPGFADFAARVPQLAIWDDHDFALNNSDRTNPVKAMSLKLFNRWWANPSAGTASTPGIFFRHSLGPVDIFMLDGRFYRDSPDVPDGPGKTLLGAGQLAWLKRELKASKAVFKLLASGVAWAAGEPGSDSWASYLHERNALFDFIRDQKISGVIGLSGDVHKGEANCIPWSDKGGYDIYDLVSSGLAQALRADFVDQNPEVRLREPWIGSVNFGLLDFTFGADPSVAMSVRRVTGQEAWDPIVVNASDLVNGKISWRRVIDKDELERRERKAAGGSYYS